MKTQNHTLLEDLIYRSSIPHLKALCTLLKKKNMSVGYPTLVNIHRGYKLENIRKRVRGKFGAQIEKGTNGKLFLPNRPIGEDPSYWVEKAKKELDLKIEITGTEPTDKNLCNVFFKILTKPRKIQYIPDEITKKKIAKIFRVSPDSIYEDRSQSGD